MTMVKGLPLVYQDGIRVIAAQPDGEGYNGVRYGVSKQVDSDDVQIVLSQSEVRELAAALMWMIAEVDAAFGRESFKPSRRYDRKSPDANRE